MMTDMYSTTVLTYDRGVLSAGTLVVGRLHGFRSFLARLTALMAAPLRHLLPHGTTQSAIGDTAIRFNQVIIPHLDGAYNFARFLSRDADAAQDIVQEAFLRAYRNFDGYRGGDARSWVFAIVRNCYHAWLHESRRRSRFETPMTDGGEVPGASRFAADDIASEEDTPESALIRKTESQCVRFVINSLPEALREVLVLRELEQLSYRQIADIIDLPIGTVMSRLARARQEFGTAWQGKDGETAS
jgi:RNA polymerase sigma factor (sigma-70 family)